MGEELQRTDEWFADRLGKVTASRIADVMAKTKSGYGAGRKNYMSQLIVERLTGTRAETFTNAAMAWGTEMEPLALAEYEIQTGSFVTPAGFVNHPSLEMTGASPDGLVGDDGLIEVKCPNTATHIATLLSKKIDSKYIKQMYWQMLCTERTWCDFVSFDPRMPEGLRFFSKRLELDTDTAETITKKVEQFLFDLGIQENELRKLAA